MVNPAHPGRHQGACFQPVYTVLENKYYMDWFNENVSPPAPAAGHGLVEGRRPGPDRRRAGQWLGRAVGWVAGAGAPGADRATCIGTPW
jgi:NADH-quinone oxidoreductase subunit L